MKSDELIIIMKMLLQGIEYLSNLDIMHWDIKPENIILKFKNKKIYDNEIKIVDFGLSSKCNLNEYLFKRCGTPGYVSYEIINSFSG